MRRDPGELLSEPKHYWHLSVEKNNDSNLKKIHDCTYMYRDKV